MVPAMPKRLSKAAPKRAGLAGWGNNSLSGTPEVRSAVSAPNHEFA